jgi:hypothetical protein
MKKIKILSFYPKQVAMSGKTISRYCPFNAGKFISRAIRRGGTTELGQ